jgi:sialate O-acetylesterase
MKSSFLLADIFTDNMVFQAEKPIKIFGKCKKNTVINFKLLDTQLCIKTKKDNFEVEFPAMTFRDKAFSISVFTKKEKITLYNCQIGDVYLFLGGMNISMPLSESYDSLDYDTLDLRVFTCNEENSVWQSTSRENFKSFGALAYLFAKRMHEIIKTPIGVIDCSHEDSRIFSLMSLHDIQNNKEIKLITDKYKTEHRLPLYSTLKNKVIPYQVKTVVIYQGENDYPYFSIYEQALKMIIKTLRIDFNQIKLPFFIIQIAGYDHPEADDYSVSMIRIAQAKASSEKDETYLVSAMDVGDSGTIKPKDKHMIANRLASLVLEKIYKIGKNNMSPSMYSYQVFPSKVTVLTKDNYLNLVSKSGKYIGFEQTENGIDFIPVHDVKVNNNLISVMISEKAREVRYAMKKFPACDIITTNDLPLLPFQIKI